MPNQQSHMEDSREHRAYRQNRAMFNRNATRVVAVSSESLQLQLAAMQTYELRHHMLHDPTLAIADMLRLPTETVSEVRRYTRLTLIAQEGVIQHIFYPVTQPARNPAQALTWLNIHGGGAVLNAG